MQSFQKRDFFPLRKRCFFFFSLFVTAAFFHHLFAILLDHRDHRHKNKQGVIGFLTPPTHVIAIFLREECLTTLLVATKTTVFQYPTPFQNVSFSRPYVFGSRE